MPSTRAAVASLCAPVLVSADVASAASFYCDRFGVEPTFTSDWYVSLRCGTWELAVLDSDHASIPAGYRGRAASGLLVDLEVEDVDAEYRRLVVEGDLDAVLPVQSGAFGQRHFIVGDPDGVLVDVISSIEPGATSAARSA